MVHLEMKMKVEEGQVFIKDVDEMQFSIIKSWETMKWNQAKQQFSGLLSEELLNQFARFISLPESLENLRVQFHQVAEAVEKERWNPNPVSLYPYPVKKKLYQHQIKAANMALLVFGLISPWKEEEVMPL